MNSKNLVNFFVWISNILREKMFIRGQCCVRVQVVKSKSESSPQSLSPSHHLKVWVRVITSESESASPSQKKIQVRVTNLVVHIFNICLSSKTWKQKQNVSNVSVNSATRHGRYCLDSGVTQARVTSHDFWVRVWVRVRVKVKKTGL